ncbi:metal-dependent transcriptional regulator [Panacibacter ginsenosidivorans]|uniref:Transcriptional regulator MntR n=1 Tax=Panacibacter ginsenosidivorans TaxID=1813871 RepID=A0A5B8V703_9BACT|nr:iron dependent repressor, metal binding and dimerization domain protein [Panacibacter ginsenosidivorans]QEC67092.1 metal-dependent transcriptional regulator [Panacibacter ginsenosidivorans]
MQPNFTATEENYIKNIYHLQQATGYTTTNELAAAIRARPASITDMLKKLKTKKIINYEPYKEFQLSTQGKKIALGIIRKHRLWEFFLVEKLQFGWDEVHEVAEELEHITSKLLIEKLDAFLDHPRFDPHGDPIPDSNGKMSLQQQVNLLSVEFNTPAEVTSVGNQSTELLEVLKHKNIHIGTMLEVKKKFSFDNSLELKIRNQPAVTISEQLARSLFVKPV